MTKIALTGGGTAGHVTPNIALLPGLYERGYEVMYVGSYEGMEKAMIQAENVPYFGIASGKFRRNLSLKNISDLKNIWVGYQESKKILAEQKPDVLFSKGGYVAPPVVWAAKKYHIPVIIHESDMTPGLANKLCYSSASKICCSFPETMSKLPEGKAVLSGSPIRKELLSGDAKKGLEFAGFDGKKPVLLMIGGSLGARRLNEVLREALPLLLPDFDVIHLCGKGNLAPELDNTPGYVQYEFIRDELKDLFAACSVVFSRAGANAIMELLALKKPNLLVPLPKENSRGDQIINARSFEKQGFSMVIDQKDLTKEALYSALTKLYQDREKYIYAMEKSSGSQGVEIILGLIDELVAKEEA